MTPISDIIDADAQRMSPALEVTKEKECQIAVASAAAPLCLPAPAIVELERTIDLTNVKRKLSDNWQTAMRTKSHR